MKKITLFSLFLVFISVPLLHGQNTVDLYAMNDDGEIAKYSYDSGTDTIFLEDSSYGDITATGGGIQKAYALAQHPITSQVYVLIQEGGQRFLWEYDIENDIIVANLGQIIETPEPDYGGINNIAFGEDGTLYGSFKTNAANSIKTINLPDLSLQSISDIFWGGGGNGLVYDFDNQKLIVVRKP